MSARKLSAEMSSAAFLKMRMAAGQTLDEARASAESSKVVPQQILVPGPARLDPRGFRSVYDWSDGDIRRCRNHS